MLLPVLLLNMYVCSKKFSIPFSKLKSIHPSFCLTVSALTLSIYIYIYIYALYRICTRMYVSSTVVRCTLTCSVICSHQIRTYVHKALSLSHYDIHYTSSVTAERYELLIGLTRLFYPAQSNWRLQLVSYSVTLPQLSSIVSVSYTHLTLPTIYSV